MERTRDSTASFSVVQLLLEASTFKMDQGGLHRPASSRHKDLFMEIFSSKTTRGDNFKIYHGTASQIVESA